MLGDAAASSSLPVLPLPGACNRQQTQRIPSLATKWSKLSVSLPHLPLTADSSLCPAPPQPTPPSPGFSILAGRLCFPCPLSQGSLNPLKPSRGPVAERASRALPAAAPGAARALLQNLPAPAPLPILSHRFGASHPVQALNLRWLAPCCLTDPTPSGMPLATCLP